MDITEKIEEVSLLPYQEDIVNKIYKLGDYLFKHTQKIKFAGFLLYGTPGNGKTEIAKQAALKIKRSIPSKIYLLDGSDIASPKWGDAEEKLKKIFEIDKDIKSKEKMILIFDDIESILLSRSAEIAKEWHYSINSVIFHLLDSIDLKDSIVIATTNRFELVDKALISRLYSIEIKPVSKDDLYKFLDYILNNEYYETNLDEIKKNIKGKISDDKIKTLRDVEHEFLISYIEKLEV
jgi:SpoVK/Ycf46/Vps4 family AAA+-type ATPase